MRRLIMLTILAGLLIVGYVCAESYPPSPGKGNPTAKPKNHTSQNKKESANYINSTDNFPPVIEISKAPVIQIETKDKPEKRRDYSSSEWWLVYLTGALAVITAALAVYTGKLYRATVNLGRDAKLTAARQAKEMEKSLTIADSSAAAAQKSADVAEKTVVTMADTAQRQLRAYVFPKHDKPMFYNSDGYLTAQIKIKNFGQTPAYNLMSSLSIVMDKLPLISKSDQPYSPMASKVPLAPSEDLAQTISLSFRLDQIEIDNIRNGQVAIFVLLVIDYIDSFKNCHHTKICLYSTGQNFDTLTLAYYSEGSYEENKNS